MTTPRWAPVQVLELDGISSGFTCIGHAKSKGRKCRSPIACANRQEASKILREMSRLDPQSPRIANKIEELACRLLCRRWHQSQAAEMKEHWLGIIADYQAATPPTTPGDEPGQTNDAGPNAEEPIEQIASTSDLSSPQEATSQAETHRHETNLSSPSLSADELTTNMPGAYPREVEGDCSICREELGRSAGDILWCRAQCRQNFHADCVNLWHAWQEVDGREKTCPYW